MAEFLVTGAGGFIGRALVARLRGEGVEVAALTRAAGDVTDPATWDSAPPARCVVHLAGRSFVPRSWEDPESFLRVNLLGTQRALDWCARRGARLVFASTYVYGPPDRLPVGEDHPARPGNPYALSKYLAEQLCAFVSRHRKVPTIALRLFNVFGPGQGDSFVIPTILAHLQRGEPVRVKDLAPRRDYVYLDDVVEALIRAARREDGGPCVNVGSGVSVSVAELIAAAQRAAGTNLPVVSANEPRADEIADVVADISRARALLGWNPATSLEEGLRRTWTADKDSSSPPSSASR